MARRRTAHLPSVAFQRVWRISPEAAARRLKCVPRTVRKWSKELGIDVERGITSDGYAKLKERANRRRPRQSPSPAMSEREALRSEKRRSEQDSLLAELTEPRERRRYSRREMLSLKRRLKRAGFTSRTGRPGANERAVLPALVAVTGMSRRRVQQILETPKPEPEPTEKALKKMQAAARAARGLLQDDERADAQELLRYVTRVEAKLRKLEQRGTR